MGSFEVSYSCFIYLAFSWLAKANLAAFSWSCQPCCWSQQCCCPYCFCEPCVHLLCCQPCIHLLCCEPCCHSLHWKA